MHRISLILLILFTLTFTACSYSIDFYVVNESNHPIEVQYKVKKNFPNRPLVLDPKPAKLATSELYNRSEDRLVELHTDQYLVDYEGGIVTVKIMPNEALRVEHMHSSIDPQDIRIEEISVKGINGELKFTGRQVFTNFSKYSDTHYNLLYK